MGIVCCVVLNRETVKLLRRENPPNSWVICFFLVLSLVNVPVFSPASFFKMSFFLHKYF